MERKRFGRLVELMGMMAGGRVAAAFDLREEFGGSLRHAVRRALRARGIELPAAEVEDLVGDVALVLYELAAAWRPDGGALPWVWAQHRIANLVDRHVGLFADDLDDERLARWDAARAGDGGRPGAAEEPGS